MNSYSENSENLGFSRRLLLQSALLVGGALLLEACGSGSSATTPTETPTTTLPTPEQHEVAKYPEHHVNATVFWIGEGADSADAGISNIPTEWEDDARKTYGGAEQDPERFKRLPNGLPANFKPLENPCYVALPASEYGDNGLLAGAREASPWASEAKNLPDDDSESLFKGRWLKITNPATGKTAYGQWLDTGPSKNGEKTQDYKYVFGDDDRQPASKFNHHAGIDLSPTLATLLGIDLSESYAGFTGVVWNFVDAQDVPEGLWSDYPAIDNKTHWN